MLDVAVEREAEGDLCLHDIGQGLPLRAGKFDGAISISAIQWLCNAVGHWWCSPPPLPLCSKLGRCVVYSDSQSDAMGGTLWI